MQKNRKYTIEAVPHREAHLCLPNFHLIAYRENGTMKAHILDFDLWVFSQDQDDRHAIKKIFERSKAIVLMFIMRHLETNTADRLYQHRVQNSGEWENFAQENNREKIIALQKSYDAFIKHPKAALERVSELVPVSNLDKDAFDELKEALNRLNSMKPAKAKELVSRILRVVTSAYDLKPINVA